MSPAPMRTVALFAVLLAGALPVHAQVSLQDVYRSALSTNKGLKSEQYTYKAEKAKVSEAWGKVLPQASATASYGTSEYTRDFDTRSSISETDTFTRADVQLNQVIYSRETFKTIERAQARAERAEATLDGQQLKIGYQAIEAYLKANRIRNEIEVVEESLASHERRLSQVESKRERGLATRSEELDARARMDEVRADLSALKHDHQAALDNLESISGINLKGQRLAPVSVAFWRQTPELLRKDWQKIARSNAAELEKVRKKLEVAAATREQNAAAHWPELHLNAQYTHNDTFATTLREELRAELQLKVPLYSGGSTSARARAAGRREEAARYQLQNTENQIEVEVSRLTQKLQGTYQKIKALETAESSASAALKAAQQGFRSGVRSLNELLDSRNRVTDLKRSMIEQTHKNAMRQFELRQRAGTLSAQSLPGLIENPQN